MSVEPVFAAKKKRKNLLETLFPKAAERARLKRKRQKERLLGVRSIVTKAPVIKRASGSNSKPIEKVEGPSYYNYRPETFKQISTKTVVAAIVSNRKQLETKKQEARELLLKKQNVEPNIETKAEELDSTNTGMINSSNPMLNENGLSNVAITVESDIAKTIEKHYAENPQHIWLDENFNPTKEAKTVLYAFKRADAYGLNAKHYEVQFVETMMGDGLPLLEAAAKFELTMTANALRYMADAKDGVINPNRISGYHDFGAYKRRYNKHLKTLLKAERPAKALFQSHPNNPQFKSLKREYITLQNTSQENVLEPIKSGTFIKPGQKHDELPKIMKAISLKGSQKLRDAHKLTIETQSSSIDYNKEIVALIKDFQANNKLSPDGIIGKNTLRKLTFDNPKVKLNRVKLAMERLRWLPENLGYKHVFINQPAYNASYMVNNKARLSMRAIVGKLSNQTNFFYDTIESVEFNPYWNVPRSILVNEKLRKLQANPYHYQKRGYEILKHGGKVVDPGTINWYEERSTKKYYIRQKPGGANALGELKILFPNKHNIYMHDTPARGLFKRSSRALSHGCVRLHKPREMAAAVMGTKISKVNSIVNAGKNKAMRVPTKMPVYVSYFTAWPNSAGKVGYYPDIYGRDKSLDKALDKTESARLKAFAS